ncbi:T9SS type A sorting domain-containing protein [Flavobacterium sp. DGU11]|uniref:T9SS type A sorting domain-containing protein n=1 Tax=Flavobacterium arundinis TaxID=3139143 RepID=A0ABU9HT34_9FLAO
MKKKYLLIPALLISNFIFSQITAIPDPAFEDWLIDNNIDSDGTINGQMLTSDAAAVTIISIEDLSNYNISDLTGIQDFTALERLGVYFTQITELDVTQNLQLKELRCGTNEISELDLSANSLLEIIDIGTGGDVGPFNTIHVLNLSSNPNINTIRAFDCYELEIINLRNGSNSPDMYIDIGLYPGWSPEGVNNTVCIEIDNEEAAQTAQLPYSEWEIDHPFVTYQLVETCELGISQFNQSDLIIYPNPAINVVTVSSPLSINNISIYDTTGRMVLSKTHDKTNEAILNVAGIQSGNYIISIFTDEGITNKNLIIN